MPEDFEQDAYVRKVFADYQADPFFEKLGAEWQPDLSKLSGSASNSLAGPITQNGFDREEIPLLPVIEEGETIKKISPQVRRGLELAAMLVVVLAGLIALVLWTGYQVASEPGRNAPTVTSGPSSKVTLVWQIQGEKYRLARPGGVAIDRQGNIYVVDNFYHVLLKFDSNGNLLSEIGSEGSVYGEFSSPRGVAVNEQGDIFVADTNNDHIQKFDSRMRYVISWGNLGKADEFNKPWAVALDNQSNVYVADTNHHRIQKFDTNGKLITEWGSFGTALGQFSFPEGLAVDAQNNVYVADSGNHRIQKFDSTGRFLTAWGRQGTGDGQLDQPQGLAVDNQNNVYVADTTNQRIQKFDSSGHFLSKWGGETEGDGQFDQPQGLAVDSQGNVYVSDNKNGRILNSASPNPAPESTPLEFARRQSRFARARLRGAEGGAGRSARRKG